MAAIESSHASQAFYSHQHIDRLIPQPLLFRRTAVSATTTGVLPRAVRSHAPSINETDGESDGLLECKAASAKKEEEQQQGATLVSDAGSDCVVIDCKCRIGESILWDHRIQSALWIDIEGKKLFRLSFESNRLETWHLGLMHSSMGRPGCIALCRSGRVLLACETGFYFFDCDTHTILFAGPAEASLKDGDQCSDGGGWQQGKLTARGFDVRLNDGRVDGCGRLIVGGINLSSSPDSWEAIHPCYVVSKAMHSNPAAAAAADAHESGEPVDAVDVQLMREYPPARITNGICFSPDGQWMYHTDTPSKRIQAFRYSSSSGQIHGAGQLIAVSEHGPDGSVTDTAGGVWNAEYEGGRVLRYEVDEAHLSEAIATHSPSSSSSGSDKGSNNNNSSDITTTTTTTTATAAAATAAAAARVSMVVDVGFVKQTTCPCLGGPDGDLLFITTASSFYREERYAAEPLAGSVLIYRLPASAVLQGCGAAPAALFDDMR